MTSPTSTARRNKSTALYAGSKDPNAVLVGLLLQAREELRDSIIVNGATPERVENLRLYSERLIALGWTPYTV